MSKVIHSYNVRVDRLLSESEASYVAGFFDGEGTLTIQSSKRPEHRAGWRHDARMSIANTNVDVLIYIRSLCGGRLVTESRKPGQKACYVLSWTPNQIRFLLPQLITRFRVKQQQAGLVMQLLALKKAGQKLTDEQWREAEQLRNRVKALNWRGSSAPPEFETLTIKQSRLGNNQWKKTL